MYSQLIYMHPSMGKNRELLDVLRERNEVSNAEGFPHIVAQQLFAPETTFVSVTQFQDLASLEAWQDRTREDAAFQDAGRRVLAAVSRQTSVELVESLAQSERTGEVRFFLAATSFAAPGRAAELRRALEASFPQTPAAGTVLRVLQRSIALEEGAAFTLSFGFASLQGLHETMHDPAFGQGSAAISGLLNRPVRQRLYRIVLPFGAGSY
jgi:heme-degrading monooxygenase HmoA